MTCYPDTSFLCALYRRQVNTPEAVAQRARMRGALPVSALLLFEFRQSVRWQTFLNRHDVSKGYGKKEGDQMLAALQSDMDEGLLRVAEVDWAEVIGGAERLSSQYARDGGHRGFDILHVATALELEAKEFLTFDSRQAGLAKAAGLKIRP